MWQKIQTWILRQKFGAAAEWCVCMCERIWVPDWFFRLYYMIYDMHDEGLTNYLDKLLEMIWFWIHHMPVENPFLEFFSMTMWAWFFGIVLYNMIMSNTHVTLIIKNFPTESHLLYFYIWDDMHYPLIKSSILVTVYTWVRGVFMLPNNCTYIIR